jgi:TonB family protein
VLRGSLLASLGLHALVIVIMIWASMASETKSKPLPSAINVKLIRPGLQLPPGLPIKPQKGEGASDEKPMKFPDKGTKPTKTNDEPVKNVPTAPTKPVKTSDTPGMGGKELKGDIGTLRVGEGGFDYDFYLAVIQSKISQNFRPPPGVRAKSSATMSFTILGGGDITDVRLAQSSGNLLIDQSAERAIRAAGRFPPLPSQYDQGRLDIYFEFVINPSANR